MCISYASTHVEGISIGNADVNVFCENIFCVHVMLFYLLQKIELELLWTESYCQLRVTVNWELLSTVSNK